MLHALYELAQDEGLLDDPDFEPKGVGWLIRVADGGKLVGKIESTYYIPPSEGKKKPKPVAKVFRVPRQPGRTSGDLAFFFCDKAEYVVGRIAPADPAAKSPTEREKKEAKLAVRRDLFMEQVRACAGATKDDAALAVLKFLERVAAGKQPIELDEETKPNDLFAFVYGDREQLVHERAEIKKYWARQRVASSTNANDKGDEPDRTCLVTGRTISAVPLFPLIKRMPGGATSGVGLVSFNKSAFESHGWSGNENAPIGEEAANACRDALNRLLDPAYADPRNPGQTLPARHIRLSDDTVVCYWGRGKRGGELSDLMADLLNPDTPERVGALYRSIWSGQVPLIDDPSAFYAVTLSGAQGRAVVRDWLETTVGDALSQLRKYFDHLAIAIRVGSELDMDRPPTLFKIKSSMARDVKDVPPPLMHDWWQVAIRGARIPDTVVFRVLSRIRSMIASGERPYPTAYAILKCWLVRKLGGKTEAMDTHINRDHPSPAYHCGRMLALLGFAQDRARGGIADEGKPAPVVQRYFSAVMTKPGLYLGRLQSLMTKAHLPKLEKHWPQFVVDEVGQISRGIGDRVPKVLLMEDQTLFALGYHHELSWLDTLPNRDFMYRAERGDHWVRSHGEEAIANGLCQLGIEYEYEPQIRIAGWRCRRPDFRVLAPTPRDQSFIEFLGRMDDAEYRNTWELKLTEYRNCGILPVEEGGGPAGKLYSIVGDRTRPDATKIRDQLREWFKPLKR